MNNLVGNEKRLDWAVIRAEYVAGGISQRKLAEKYGITYNTLRRRAESGDWVKAREKQERRSAEKAAQKTASAVANNAEIAQRIKQKLLLRLEREIDSIPDVKIGSLMYTQTEGHRIDEKTKKPVKTRSGIEYKLREFAAAYKDLTSDMDMTARAENPLLQSLLDLERRAKDAGD